MKKVWYAILILIALYFVLAFFGPEQIQVERQIVINAPSSLIKEKLGDFRFFHEKWSPWTEKDRQMKTQYTGIPGESGHVYGWSGNDEVGTGEIEFERYSGDSVIQKIRFKGQGDAHSYFIAKDLGGRTALSWGMNFGVGFLFRTPMLFINMEEMMAQDLEAGLSNLKAAVESDPSH